LSDAGNLAAACGAVSPVHPAPWQNSSSQLGAFNKEPAMIKWAIIFFIISVVAGFFGFTGVASGARTMAKVLFFIALIIFLIVLIFGVLLGKLVF
jgi:uncharacterized membrane protein YtjA (UPF0391 family)